MCTAINPVFINFICKMKHYIYSHQINKNNRMICNKI